MASRLWAWTHGYHAGSVLPRIPGRATGNGFNVTIDRTGGGEVASWGCVAVVLIGGLLLVADDIRRPHPRIGSDLAFLSFAIGALAAMHHVFVRRRFRKGTLHVTPWPLRLGSRVNAELNAFVAGEQQAPSARLECVEQAISGRKTRYEAGKIATMFSIDLSPASLQWTKTKLHAAWSFEIPRDGVPSFHIRDRELLEVHERLVEWRVVATIPTSAGESVAEFPLLVVPEIVA